MAKWLRMDCVTPANPKMIRAGHWGYAVAIALWQLAKLHDKDDGDVTQFWDEYQIGRQTLLDQEGEPGLALVRLGMERVLAVGLVDTRKRRGRRPKRTSYPVAPELQLDPNSGQQALPHMPGPPPNEALLESETDRIKISCVHKVDPVTSDLILVTKKHHLFIHNYQEYQRARIGDGSAAERKRRQRGRKKAKDEVAEKWKSHRSHSDNCVTVRDSHARRDETRRDGTGRDETGEGPVTPPPPPLVFSQILTSLIQEAHPDRQLDQPARYAKQAEQHEQLGIDLKDAAAVATWAFRHSGTWADGWSWPQALTSPEKFWQKYDTLEQQFNGRTNRTRRGRRVAPLKSKGKLTAKKASDYVRKKKEPTDG